VCNPKKDDKMNFADLRLAEPILRAIASEGYREATPIQAQTIPHVLAGRDVLGSAQTGTGKTAAFALPTLHRLADPTPAPKTKRRPRCLVLCPTRELAKQINDGFNTYGQNLAVTSTMIFGGVSQTPQVKALRRGVDVIVATPGRLQDLFDQGHVDLRGIDTLVLDEADRMLDMGFVNDIKRIAEQLPPQRQTLLFSATMPEAIRKLTKRLQNDPVTLDLAPKTATVDAVNQSVYFVSKQNKTALLKHLMEKNAIDRALVFTRTKHGADRLAKQLNRGQFQADAIHGNKTQNARQRALKDFSRGHTSVLVATDVASRGIDVDGISHVINYDLTDEPETYVHRIGRTGRAGASGEAVSFCDHDEQKHLKAIERMIQKKIPVQTDAPSYSEPKPLNKPGASANGSRQNRPRKNDPSQAQRGRANAGQNGRPRRGNLRRRPRS
jgi:ATP-dependent RNA helicase RhlE